MFGFFNFRNTFSYSFYLINIVLFSTFYSLSLSSKIISINDYQKSRFTRKMLNRMFNTVTGKRIAMFGFAFKKDTGDTRESPAAFVAKGLLEEGALLQVLLHFC